MSISDTDTTDDSVDIYDQSTENDDNPIISDENQATDGSADEAPMLNDDQPMASANQDASMDPTSMDHSMQSMDGMASLELTGNPDIDFFAAMITHHQGAISMVEIFQEKLTDPFVQQLAQAIIDAQQAEVFTMQAWLAEHPASEKDKQTIADSEQMMTETMQVMNQMDEVLMTGNPSKEFVQMMIPHHQAAVVMSQSILPKLKDE